MSEKENGTTEEVTETELEKLNTEAASEPEVTADLNGDGVVDTDEAEIDAALKSLDTKTIEPPKKHKFGWVGYVFLCVVIGLGIWSIFKITADIDGDAKSLSVALAGGDWVFGLIAFGVLLLIIFSEWMKYAIIMKTTTGKYNFRSSLKVGLLGKFYDNVTPFAVGGQPMQIYYLHKKGFSGGVSSAVILIKYFAQMFCYTLVSLLFMACNTGVLDRIDYTLRIVITVGAWVGLVVNMFLPLMIILFAVLPKFARKLASLVVGLGAKVKIVKDKDATMAKAEKVVSDFRAGFKIMSRKPLKLIGLVFFCLLEVLLTFSLPYFVMRGYSALPLEGELSGFSLYLTVVALNVYCTQAVAIVPTPGSSGVIDAALAGAYIAIAVTSLSWALFTWRFAIYYIYLIIGMGLVIFELIRKIYRARKAKKSAVLSATDAEDQSNQTEITENGDE